MPSIGYAKCWLYSNQSAEFDKTDSDSLLHVDLLLRVHAVAYQLNNIDYKYVANAYNFLAII